ncbi:uncharacterized protein LOC117625258 [Prunus dulcis]|nr:uncharacterized protein LOC117625258 [Prunus dulcis]
MEKGITIPESKKKKAAEETSTEEDDEKMVAILMKDAKALGIIQNSVSDKIFPCIAMLIKLKWHGICYMKNIMVVTMSDRYKGKPECYNYEKFGHLARECTASKNVQKANCANQMEVTGNLFYANNTIAATNVIGEWYINSGYSNHMTRNESLLTDIRTNVVGKVQMPNGELVNVAGMGTLAIDTTKGKKYIKEVMYLPGLKENLLSVGQMDEHGYYLVFGGKLCSIFEGPSLECLVIKVEMKRNRCYPLALLSNDHIALKASVSNFTWTWHKRLGQLHLKGLSQLKEKDMVHGLPFMEKVDGVCEGCHLGKQH